jgi:hypothetical protein
MDLSSDIPEIAMLNQFVRFRSALFALVAAVLVAAPSSAQHGSGSPADQGPPREAAQFDFLVGDWELVGKPVAKTLAQKIHGVRELRGTWKAHREFDDRGVEDELRLTDRAGNPLALLHSMRVYDPAAKHWIISGLDPYRAAISSSTAEWRGAEMVVTGSGTDEDARAFLSRSKYFDITPASFRFGQERSYDGGRSWADAGVKIEAKRSAPTSRK